ncbi:MAG: tRNA lysidine(34) synthetase TilS, partial [Candidatus Moranbacteria bacterium]|nr:tRNA lysidine(34) synthetase TilS [Candidatus Moranbacteria bacterium]
MNLIKKIQENVFRYQLFERRASAKGGFASGGKIVVGCSGGPDSVCLLDILRKLKDKYGLEIVVAHVNYGLRGKDSELDEKLVSNLAKKYSLPLETKKIPNTKYQIPNTISEDNLRKIRYAFFEQTRKKYKADAIAVGHNLNDQAETVLMRILRGTGLRGLSAIKFRNEKIIRPLLNVPRKEIMAYLRRNKLPFRTDKTNLGTDFTRNKIRNKFLPYIVKDYNPNIEEVLYKLSQSAADDYDFIGKYSAEWLKANKSLRVSKL